VNTLRTAFTSLTLLATVAGCSFAVRSPDMYRDDTAKVLASKSADIQACYDGILKSKPGTAGKATVKFNVEVKTGAFTDVAVDKANTTVPDDVAACVTTAMAGLALAPLPHLALQAQQASLVYTLGRDTIAIEQWTRTATALSGR